MKIVNALAIALLLALATLPASGQDKAAGKAQRNLAIALTDFVERSFPDATAPDRASIVACVLEATTALNAESRALLTEYGFDRVPVEQQAELAARYPEVMQAVASCPPRAALLTLRTVKVHAGGVTFSVRYGGQSSLPNQDIHYDSGILRVGGDIVDLPDFERLLEVRVAEDGSVAFTIDQ